MSWTDFVVPGIVFGSLALEFLVRWFFRGNEGERLLDKFRLPLHSSADIGKPRNTGLPPL